MLNRTRSATGQRNERGRVEAAIGLTEDEPERAPLRV
jgi:hypothetical protein